MYYLIAIIAFFSIYLWYFNVAKNSKTKTIINDDHYNREQNYKQILDEYNRRLKTTYIDNSVDATILNEIKDRMNNNIIVYM